MPQHHYKSSTGSHFDNDPPDYNESKYLPFDKVHCGTWHKHCKQLGIPNLKVASGYNYNPYLQTTDPELKYDYPIV